MSELSTWERGLFAFPALHFRQLNKGSKIVSETTHIKKEMKQQPHHCLHIEEVSLEK